MEKGGAVFSEQALRSGNPAAVVFTAGDVTFTAGDLTARVAKMRGIMSEGPAAGDAASRETIAREYFSDTLLVAEAARRGLDRDPEYLKRIAEARETYLAGDYIEYASGGNIGVTPAEVRKEYDTFKASRYYSIVSVNGKERRPPVRGRKGGHREGLADAEAVYRQGRVDEADDGGVRRTHRRGDACQKG